MTTRLMDRKEKRRSERVKSYVRVKLPGDAAWTECVNSNISADGLLFEATKQLKVGVLVAL